MFSELSAYYFLKALKLAKDADLTNAVQYAAVAIGMNQDNEECKRLTGLCYYQLGNYAAAEYYFDNTPYYIEHIEKRLLEKKDRLADRKQLVDKGKYKEAVRELEKEEDKNVNEYTYLGCLYAVLHKKKKAIFCFLEALKQDRTNEEALRCLNNIEYAKKRRWWQREGL